MLKHHLWVLILAVAAVLFAAAFALTRGPREPQYEGKPLSIWLDDLRISEGGGIVLAEPSVRAVRAIGTNAVPFLLAMLRCSDSDAKMALAIRVVRYSPRLNQFFGRNFEKRQKAFHGLRALGLDARSAFPEIVSLILASDQNVEAVNALTEANESAITLLTRGLASSDPKVRERAVYALSCLRQAPSISVPALVQTLNDPDPAVRRRAAGALSCYGSVTNQTLTGHQ